MDFQMHIHRNSTNTFIRLEGTLCAHAAAALAQTIDGHAQGTRSFFISTDGVTGCHDGARELFHSELRRRSIAPASLYFKGGRAFELAPDGGRVLVARKQGESGSASAEARSASHGKCSRPGCTGHCATCPRCRSKAEHAQ